MAKNTLMNRVSLLELRMDMVERRMESRPQTRMMTSEEAAAFLGMTLDGLHGLTHRKLIPFYKPNRKNMYFDVDELVAWQKKHHFEPIYELGTK